MPKAKKNTEPRILTIAGNILEMGVQASGAGLDLVVGYREIQTIVINAGVHSAKYMDSKARTAFEEAELEASK